MKLAAWLTLFAGAPRQLLTARLYHTGWWLTLLHGVLSTLVPAVGVALLVVGTATGDAFSVSSTTGGLLLFHLNYILLIAANEFSVRHVLATRSQHVQWLTAGVFLLTLPSVVLTEIIYPWILLRAVIMKRATWRGIDYRIGPSNKITMKEYRPYETASDLAGHRSL